MSVIINASQSIGGKGQITIATYRDHNRVHVAIRDTGKGIQPEDLQTIFDPGFTTKEAVIRARLGLSISYQIVQEHRGRIEVESVPGEGSVFTVIIPI